MPAPRRELSREPDGRGQEVLRLRAAGYGVQSGSVVVEAKPLPGHSFRGQTPAFSGRAPLLWSTLTDLAVEVHGGQRGGESTWGKAGGRDYRLDKYWEFAPRMSILGTLEFPLLGASAHLLVPFTPVSCPAYSLDFISDATVAG